MTSQTSQTGEIQNMGNWVHKDPAHPLQQDFSWLNIDGYATPMYDTSDTDESNDDEEVPYGARAHHSSDWLPPAWCREAEKETPEPEEPLNARSNPVTQARRAIHGAGLSSYAHSAAHTSMQQNASHKLSRLSDIVCGLELGRDAVRGEVMYRKKVLGSKIVDQGELCEMMDKKCVHMVFYDNKPVSNELLELMYKGLAVFMMDFEVVVATEKWSDWMSLEGYKADEDSYNLYQTLLGKGESF